MGDGDNVVVRRDVPVGDLATVGVVLALSVGSGFVVFVGLGLLCWALRWSVGVAMAGAGVVVLAVWLVWVGRVERLFVASEVVQTVASARAEAKPVVSVEVLQPETGRMAFLDLPGGPEQLGQLAAGLLSGRTFAEAEWTGAGRPYSRSEFRELRSQLMERGLAAWRNTNAPSQGVQLTAVGRSVFRHIAQEARTHAHAGGGGQFALLDEGG